MIIVAGFFVYFDSMSLSDEAECEDDYVQFGRDILFITSHRSNKYCGNIEGSLVVPTSQANNSTLENSNNVTPLGQPASQCSNFTAKPFSMLYSWKFIISILLMEIPIIFGMKLSPGIYSSQFYSSVS